MEAQVILGLGVLILFGGCLSMLILRLCSPNLQGVGWLCAAYASGTAGAGLLLARGVPLFSVLLADLALLAAFVLLHVAVLKLAHSSKIHFWHGAVLLGLQAMADSLTMAHVISGRSRVAFLSVLVALQGAVTAGLLRRMSRDYLRSPATYSAMLLLGFSCFNLFRAGVLIADVGNSFWRLQLSLLAFSLFLTVALGLAFGFFWMTTAQLTAEIEHMASTDPLTRVYNRRVFLRWCEKELLRSQRSGVPFSLLMLDLDHFKQINDNFGHQRGDEVLCSSVERMQDSVRGIDVLCRWGGEEFAVLLPNATVEATQIVAERIRENIQRMQVALSAKDGPEKVATLTVSIGSATYREIDDDIPAMLLRADQALYTAKNTGRNQVLIGA